MPSLIHELENNEALLTMFVAGELPPDDRLEVEQMLAGDAGMRAELVNIQTAYTASMNMLAALDSDRSALPAENHAVRQAMRAMRQWQVDRLARQPVVVAPSRMRIPVWLYPVAGVAALLIGTIAWWGFGGQFHLSVPPAGQVDGETGDTGSPSVASTVSSDDAVAAFRVRDSFNSDVLFRDASNNIADAETQAKSLVARSDSSAVSSAIFFSDANP